MHHYVHVRVYALLYLRYMCLKIMEGSQELCNVTHVYIAILCMSTYIHMIIWTCICITMQVHIHVLLLHTLQTQLVWYNCTLFVYFQILTSDCGEDVQTNACKLLEVIVIQCQGRIDAVSV